MLARLLGNPPRCDGPSAGLDRWLDVVVDEGLADWVDQVSSFGVDRDKSTRQRYLDMDFLGYKTRGLLR